ncbi:MAG: D-galactonate dehydratase family protein [Cellulomonadaceae bacterium]|nr:D-galactonate dehydratase family protein [Cellulomonadaceae bacterium]
MASVIVSADVIVSSPGRNYVTLKIVTRDGVVGWGDATVNGRELAVASYLRDHVCPLLIGRDAQRIEQIWQWLYRGAYWRRGPITMAASGAVDLALWDIKGKELGVPVYQLLGGAVRDGVLAYSHASGWELPELLDAVDAKLADGYLAVRAQSGIPGRRSVYAVASPDPEPDVAGQPSVEVWDTGAYLRHVPGVLTAVRAHVGDAVHLLHDAHHRLTPIEAARLGRDLEPVRLFWLEDVTPGENQEALALVRAHTTTPLAIGEVFNTIWDCMGLITSQSIDYIRSSVMHAGGISPSRRINDLAALYQVKVAPHGPSDVSPITMAASLHLDIATPNLGIQEFMGYPPQAAEVFRHGYSFSDGYLHPGDLPGLGVDVDEKAAAAFPYVRSYLPVARRDDGTPIDW